MEHVAARLFSTEVSEEYPAEAGIFTWELERNTLFADAAVADLFGLDPQQVKLGLPLEAYLARVHPDDVPQLAKVISDAIIADVPQQDTYRVRGRDGVFRMVVAYGRAFRGPEGLAVLYSGIVIPAPETKAGLLN